MSEDIKVQQFLRQFEHLAEVPENSTSGADEFRKFPKWDSLKEVELVAMLDELGISVDPEAIEACKTVSDVCQVVSLRV